MREIWTHIRTTFKEVLSGFISFWVIFGLLIGPIGVLFAILAALGGALVAAILAVLLPKITTRCAASIALWAITRATKDSSTNILAQGIDDRSGSVVVRLGVGSSAGVTVGDRFEVVNNASRRKWGVLEALEVEEHSCLCWVSARIQVEFWEALESRMDRDPSPPAGIAIAREVPEGLLEFVTRLLRNWGG